MQALQNGTGFQRAAAIGCDIQICNNVSEHAVLLGLGDRAAAALQGEAAERIGAAA